MSTSTRTNWKRLVTGCLRTDGAWFLERGARMSTGGTNAWLILRRVPAERIGRDGGSAYDTKTGGILWRVDTDGTTETVDADYEGDLYVHDLDAGSLAEAKYTVTVVETEEQP